MPQSASLHSDRGPAERNSLEAVDESAVRAKLQILHDFLQADQVPDVDRRWVLELLRGGVEVEEVDGATEGLGVGDEGGAESRFACSGGAGD